MSNERVDLPTYTTYGNKVTSWIRTTRIQTGMVTALALWAGYITVKPLSYFSAAYLTIIGLAVHVWGFTLNEVEDYEYDAKMGDVDGHPIAKGEVNPNIARAFAWSAAFVALGLSLFYKPSVQATAMLVVSFIPGWLYNKWSKVHWWSPAYLSLWSASIVMTGSLYAGNMTSVSTLVAVALGIQIFVQVIEGDLKDIGGPEDTLIERFGVKLEEMQGKLLDMEDMEKDMEVVSSSSCKLVSYSPSFTISVYLLKIIEGVIIVAIAAIGVAKYGVLSQHNIIPGESVYYGMMLLLLINFIATLNMSLVYVYDRDEIKKKASAHEISSILLLGVALMPLDIYGAMLIMLAPVCWYLVINTLLYSNALNPDI